MNKKALIKNNNLITSKDKRVDTLYKQIASVIREARAKVVRAVDISIVQTYWNIGKYIIEEEQRGRTRADYGNYLINNLSSKLTNEFGKGFGIATLENARKFYIVYGIEKPYAMRRKLDRPQFSVNLSWVH